MGEGRCDVKVSVCAHVLQLRSTLGLASKEMVLGQIDGPREERVAHTAFTQ